MVRLFPRLCRRANFRDACGDQRQREAGILAATVGYFGASTNILTVAFSIACFEKGKIAGVPLFQDSN